MPNEYTALRGIMAPGTTVFGYHRGSPVSAQVVDTWGLAVGTANDPDADVVAGDLPAEEAAPVAVPRPTAADNRATWEAYAVANGMSAEDAAMASQEDLEAIDPAGVAVEPSDPERPSDSAPKADWIVYAEARGADPEWTHASGTTKADLQAYEPVAGDTVAVAATEANQG